MKIKTTTTAVIKLSLKYPMSRCNTCIAEPNLEVVIDKLSVFLLNVLNSDVRNDCIITKSHCFYYQMKTNSAVNRNLVNVFDK